MNVSVPVNVTSCDDFIQMHISILWYIFYIAIQLLGWIILPLCQSYVASGEFTFFGKIKASVIENSIWYIVYLVVGVISLIAWFIYAIVKRLENPGLSLVGLLISLSNAFGLILLTTFSGYGIVGLPRWLWNSANYEKKLHYYEYMAGSSADAVDEQIDNFKGILSQVRSLDMYVNPMDPLRVYVDQIVELAQPYLDKYKITDARKSEDELTYKSLVKLNWKVMEAIRTTKRVEFEWKYLHNQYFFTQDVIESSKSGDMILNSPFFRKRTGSFWNFVYRIEYFYRVWFLPTFKRSLAILFILFSIVFMWCELISPIGKEIQTPNFDGRVLSIFHLVTIGFARVNGILVQISSMISLLLISSYIYFTLFNLKILKWMQMIPYHTDSGSLLFLAVFLCRLIPTLGYNFLMMAGVDIGNGVAFSRVMGSMKLLDLNILGPIFYYVSSFFPLLIIFVATMTLFNIVERCFKLVGLASYLNMYTFSDDTDDVANEGRDRLARQRKRKGMEVETKSGQPKTSKERLKQILIKTKKVPVAADDELGGYGSI